MSQSVVSRILYGWLLGILGSAAGLWFSFISDLPSGATMVVVLGSLPLLSVAVKRLNPRNRSWSTKFCTSFSHLYALGVQLRFLG